jgi:hypothetical protein
MICDIGDLRPGTPARISAANAHAVHRRPTGLAGPCFLRYSLADGTRPWEHVGDDPDEAITARERKQAHFEEDTFNISIEETFAQDSLILIRQLLKTSLITLKTPADGRTDGASL